MKIATLYSYILHNILFLLMLMIKINASETFQKPLMMKLLVIYMFQ